MVMLSVLYEVYQTACLNISGEGEVTSVISAATVRTSENLALTRQ